jgi:hypothetical protein
MAIQLIINKELGLAKNQNPLQGAFIIEELTDLVEEAVFQSLTGLRKEVVCWVQWKPCIKDPKFRKNHCTTKT